ncbi:hypothetical protein [uncultured Croceitalea sp.]|uniref:hypothetical protein n=1 Tax=uncultured Croceitalea sp. TaxID=1798908 RepID=UPI00374ED5D8
MAETEKEQEETNLNTLKVYEMGETRTIDFILTNGTRQNFAYSHYLTAWLGKEDKDRFINIFFATHMVTIKGYCLDKIYNAITTLSVKSIKAHDKRYLDLIGEGNPFVTEIKIGWKKEENLNK